jgi:hypothetical protein
LFQAAWEKMHTKRHLWEEIRHLFRAFLLASYSDLLLALIRGIERQQAVLRDSS